MFSSHLSSGKVIEETELNGARNLKNKEFRRVTEAVQLFLVMHTKKKFGCKRRNLEEERFGMPEENDHCHMPHAVTVVSSRRSLMIVTSRRSSVICSD